MYLASKSVMILIFHVLAFIFDRLAWIQVLTYGVHEYVVLPLDEIFAIEDDSEIGYFVEVDLESTDATEEKFRLFSFMSRI